MTRALGIAVGAAAALALALAGSGLWRAPAGPARLPAAGIPTQVVEQGKFVRTVSAEGHLAAVHATPITAPVDGRAQLRIAWIAEDGAILAEGAEVVRFDAIDFERNLADGEADLETASTKIDKAVREHRTLRQNFETDAELADLELEQVDNLPDPDPLIFSRHEIVDMEIDQDLAQMKAENARSRSETAATQGRTESDLLEIERSQAELKIREARAVLGSLVVRAPHPGMLVLDRDWRGEVLAIGDETWPGQKLAEIPDPAAMELRAYVLEADAGGLEDGCPAEMIVESHPGRSFAALVERVEVLAKRRHWNVPVQYFEVTIVPGETDPEVMRPGQAARAEIILEEIEQAITVPRQAVFTVEDADTVYRKEGDHLEPVRVTLGPKTISRVQVLEGLQAGDEVALRDPRTLAGGKGKAADGGTAAPSTVGPR